METRSRLVPVVVTALVAALAGVGALVWYALAPSSQSDSGTANAPSTMSTRDAAVTPESAPQRGESAESAGAPVVAPDAAQRVEEEVAVPENRLLVTVRRAEDRVPLAGATVIWAGEWLLGQERQARDETDDSYADENELVEDVGTRGTTDARGRCFVPISAKPQEREPLTICARAETRWGLIVVPPSRRSVDLFLSAADALRVQVLASDGSPLPGVVATFGMRGQSHEQARRARTEGKDAIATIRGIGAFTRMFGDTKGREWGVSVRLPLRTRAFVPVDLDALPTEPLVLRLPACGRMAIALRGRDGQPIRKKARVHVIGFPRIDVQPGTNQTVQRGSVCEQSLATGDGWLELPYVDCGLSLQVSVAVDRVPVGNAMLDGPDAVGERVERSVALEFGLVKFTGVMLRADDSPAAGETVVLRAVANRGLDVRPFEEPAVADGTTDAQGRFTIALAVAGGEPESFDCEVVVKSATGLDRTLKAIAVVAERHGDAFMGTLRVPER